MLSLCSIRAKAGCAAGLDAEVEAAEEGADDTRVMLTDDPNAPPKSFGLGGRAPNSIASGAR